MIRPSIAKNPQKKMGDNGRNETLVVQPMVTSRVLSVPLSDANKERGKATCRRSERRRCVTMDDALRAKPEVEST